ncbi:MAG TPA: NlpC/P60 family protein [Patescibacteria group bacterium]|nr:NlpC/P60 family protein [Patescibacteria group bacterium]
MDDIEQAQRAAVVAEARSWLRTPYHHMGRVKGVGVDCAMLPAEVYAACGLIPPQSVEFYPMDWHLHQTGERYLARVLSYAHEVAEPSPGDMVMWRYGRCLAHGGIVVAWPRIIHSVIGHGVLADDGASMSLNRVGRPRERRFYTLWETAP